MRVPKIIEHSKIHRPFNRKSSRFWVAQLWETAIAGLNSSVAFTTQHSSLRWVPRMPGISTPSFICQWASTHLIFKSRNI